MTSGRTMIQKLSSGDPVIGLMVFEFATPGLARVLERARIDFAILDTESTAFTWNDVQQFCAGCTRHGVTPMVRLLDIRASEIGRTLDLGAIGLMAPKVDSAAQAEAFVRAALLPPCGERGSGHGLQIDGMEGLSASARAEATNDATFLICQVESRQGVDNCEAIAAVPGISALALGLNDLTSSLGMPGMTQHPDVVTAVARVQAAASNAGKQFLLSVASPEAVRDSIARGYRLLLAPNDILTFSAGLRQTTEAVASHSAGAHQTSS